MIKRPSDGVNIRLRTNQLIRFASTSLLFGGSIFDFLFDMVGKLSFYS